MILLWKMREKEMVSEMLRLCLTAAEEIRNMQNVQ